jgi:hypothetical protein
MSILRGMYNKEKRDLIMPTKGVLDFTAIIKLDFKQGIKPRRLTMKDIYNQEIFKAIKEN